MTIRAIERKYNPEIKRRERCLGDREFHSLQEVKSYCIDRTPYTEGHDGSLFGFMIMDTQEQIDVYVGCFRDEESEYCVELDYHF